MTNSIDAISEREFPHFVQYLREQFGERVSTGSYTFEGGCKERCPILLDEDVVGHIERIFSKDGKKLMSKNAAIKSEILPIETNVEMVSLMFYAEKGERKDEYNVPFP